MKRASALFALTAMAAATIALAQQATPQTPAQPPASATSEEQTTPPSEPSARTSSADKQALMKDCLTQVQAANPNVPPKDIQAYCDKQVNSPSSPQD